MRIAVAAAGNAEKNINIINARFQAEALRQLRGYDTGVLVNSFYSSADPTGENRDQNADFMWKLTAEHVNDIAVGRGMATAYGFDIQSEETVHFTATAPSVGTKYLFIYLEWNFGNPNEASGEIDIRDNGSSSRWTPSRRDNLITNPIGSYQMILYRLQVNTSGRITATTKWNELGVISIGCPLFALYCARAKNSDFADYAFGRTDKKLSEHLSNIYSELAILGNKLTPRSGAAAVNATTLCNSLIRQGDVVMFNFRATSNPSGLTVPQGFRPKADTTILCIYQTSSGVANVVGYVYSTATVHTDGSIDCVDFSSTGSIRYTAMSIFGACWITGNE